MWKLLWLLHQGTNQNIDIDTLPSENQCREYVNGMQIFFIWHDIWCFNTTFSNISTISWRTVLVVEEAGVPGENHRPWASNW